MKEAAASFGTCFFLWDELNIHIRLCSFSAALSVSLLVRCRLIFVLLRRFCPVGKVSFLPPLGGACAFSPPRPYPYRLLLRRRRSSSPPRWPFLASASVAAAAAPPFRAPRGSVRPASSFSATSIDDDEEEGEERKEERETTTKKKRRPERRRKTATVGDRKPARTTSKASDGSGSSTARERNKMPGGGDATPVVTHAPESLIPPWMNRERTKVLAGSDESVAAILPRSSSPSPASNNEKSGDEGGECVLYWMQRDVRVADNWALLFASHIATERGVPLRVCYALPPPPPPPEDDADDDNDDDGLLPPKVTDMRMTKRHGKFLLDGLKCVESELGEFDVPFDVLLPGSRHDVGGTVVRHASLPARRAVAVVCDMSPLRHHREWTEVQAAPLLDGEGVPLVQVDAHNVVPVWTASPKREVGARTLRTKINKLLPDFMTHYPKFEGNSHLSPSRKKEMKEEKGKEIDWEGCERYLRLDGSVPPCDWAKAGTATAISRFKAFCTPSPGSPGLKKFDELRNDPNADGVCSDLSPWINHGHVSFQRLALDVRALKKYSNGTAAFIEEGIVRRELSDNYVYYERDGYDSLDGAAGWARESLELHASDVREYVYTLEEFEGGETHDDLWNAAQLQLVREGRMHGFLRMYWAKKILEWTATPLIALRTAQYFNDRYALDGNDPNGFVGVGWSVMGVHDMGWKERDVFGKIRFMNYAGCKRKFKVDTFVAKYPGAKANAIAASKKKHGHEKTATAISTTKKGSSGKKKKAPAGGRKRKAPSS